MTDPKKSKDGLEEKALTPSQYIVGTGKEQEKRPQDTGGSQSGGDQPKK